MPRILFLAASDWYFWCHRLPLAVAAQAKGHDVTVCTPDGDYRRLIEEAGVRHVAVEMNRQGRDPLDDAKTLGQLVIMYLRLKPDLVHHVAVKPVLYGTLAAKIARVPAVVNALAGMGYVFLTDEPLSRAIRPVLKSTYRALLNGSNTRTILQNPDDVEAWVKWKVLRRDRIELIRGAGVNTQRFAPTPEPPGPPLVILPARLLRDKGVVEFVEAARILKQRGVHGRFALVGEGDLGNPSAITPSEVEGWVKAGLVESFGWRDDMAEVHRQAHVVCLPSYGEGLPKALLEAAASGRPIVATDVPGCREIARDNALLVKPRDAIALANALEKLLVDPALRKRLGDRGREIVVSEFSQEVVTGQVLALYDRLLAKR